VLHDESGKTIPNFELELRRTQIGRVEDNHEDILRAVRFTSTGYMISACSPNISMATALASPLIIPLSLLGGFYLNVG
jgi:hypothetical protein